MSGIFGLICLDGAPILESELSAMHAAMAHWGPDGGGTWFDGSAGLGQCLLFNTPEAVHEKLPRVFADGHMVLTAEARIDNRDELCDYFRIRSGERASTVDSELILRAYECWGEDSPAHLFGDWSFAVWHRRERRLFLARDHQGHTSLYYFHDGRRFAFASDRRALLALPHVPRRLNELYLAQILVSWPAYHGRDTIYRDVHRLPPAHALIIANEQMRSWRFWRLEDAPDVELPTADEYAEALREQLRRAVRSQLRSLKPIAVSLSGGLDSGSVAVLAARELGTGGAGLLAFTSVPLHKIVDPSLSGGDEFAQAAATARTAGIVDHEPITAAKIGPIEGIERMLEIHGEPAHAADNHYWVIALHETARVRGVGTLLTGLSGNGTISWKGRPTLMNAFAALGRGHVRHGLSDAAISLRLSWLVSRYGQRQLRGEGPRSQPWRGYSAIHPAFAARLQLRERMIAAGHDPTFTTFRDGREARLLMIRTGRSLMGARKAEIAAAFGLEIRDPTGDTRLMSFTLGIPDRFWRGPRDRWLIRAAMRGLLPDEVRLATRRGQQAADIVPRLRADSLALERLLAEVGASPLAVECLDLNCLREIARRAQNSNTGQMRDQVGTILMRGLAAGAFLSRAAWTE